MYNFFQEKKIATTNPLLYFLKSWMIILYWLKETLLNQANVIYMYILLGNLTDFCGPEPVYVKRHDLMICMIKTWFNDLSDFDFRRKLLSEERSEEPGWKDRKIQDFRQNLDKNLLIRRRNTLVTPMLGSTGQKIVSYQIDNTIKLAHLVTPFKQPLDFKSHLFHSLLLKNWS